MTWEAVAMAKPIRTSRKAMIVSRGTLSVRATDVERLRSPRRRVFPTHAHNLEGSVITLGVILLIIGFIAKIAILWVIGIVLVVVGLVLALLGMMGRAVGGRAHYY